MSDDEDKPRRRSRRTKQEEAAAEWTDQPSEWFEIPPEQADYHPEAEIDEPAPPKKPGVKLKPANEPQTKLKAKTPKRPPKQREAPTPKPVKPAKQPKAPKSVSAAPAVAAPARSPLIGWIPLFRDKPRMEVKAGKAAKTVKDEARKQPFTFWKFMVQLIPVWVLLIMILILEPALPFRAVGAVANWAMSQLPARPTQPASEPVFIVEGAGEAAPVADLPEPNWPLEISPLFMPSVHYWADSIAEWSVTYRIKPNMIATILQIESCGNPTAVSSAGATGLLQVMPLHFDEGEDMTDPNINARRGLLYLGQMLAEANGDPGLTFAAYNGGPSMLYASPVDWPSETRDYQFWASGIYEDAELGLDDSPTLDAWLEAGGASLCAQASAILGIGQ